jgi:hypothetical protein
MSNWTWVLTNNALVPQGEILNASQRRLAIPLSKLSTASFQIRLDNPLAANLEHAEGMIKVYRDSELMFYGPVVSAEETASRDSQTLAVNAVDAGWFLQHRLAGKSKTGQMFAANIDRAVVCGTLIVIANTEANTFVWPDSMSQLSLTSLSNSFGQFSAGSFTRPAINYTNPISAGSAVSTTTSYAAGPYKPILEIIRELSVGQDGFDWAIVPYDNHVPGAVAPNKIGEFRAWPLRGQDQSEAVFEYGTGRHNIQDYKRTVNRDGQANKVYHIAAPGPDAPGYPVVSAINSASISDWGLLEDLAAADLLTQSLRQRLVDEHVRVRSYPRQVVEFTPHIFVPGRMPNYGTDYRVGDNVRARIAYNDRVKLDALVRVWGVGFDIDELGVERVSLTLAEEA